jgi:hypothetical protein
MFSSTLGNILKLVYFLVFSGCSVAFLIQANNLWHKYQQELSAVTTSMYKFENTTWPVITICPFDQYKNVQKFEHWGRNMSNHLFNLTDILDPISFKQIVEEKWEIHEIYGPYMGRCYSLRNPSPANELNFFHTISLHRKLFYTVSLKL